MIQGFGGEKSIKMRWTGHVARVRVRDWFRVLVGKPERH